MVPMEVFNNTLSSDDLHALYGSSPCRVDKSFGCVMSNVIWNYITPSFIFIGVLGNIVSLIVLSRKNFRRSRISTYLITLALVDLMTLLTVYFNQWMISLGFKSLSEISDAGCRFSMWTYYGPIGLSIGITAGLGMERAASIKFPIWAKRHLSAKLTKFLMLGACLVWFLASSHILMGFTLDPSSNLTTGQKCVTVSAQYSYFHYTTWPMIANGLFGVNLLLILMSNIAIAHVLIKRKWHKEQSSNSTELVFGVCVFFCICCIPAMLFLLVRTTFTDEMVRRNFTNYKMAFAVVSNLICANSTFNFVFYGLIGRKFRLELKQSCLELKMRLLRPAILPNGTDSENTLAGENPVENELTETTHM